MAISDWTKVAAIDEIKPGEPRRVVVGDDEVVLARVDGEVMATSDVCSHEYYLLSEGFQEDYEIECPQHGSRFDLRTGAVRNLPATQPIPVYEVRIESNDVLIRGPKERA